MKQYLLFVHPRYYPKGGWGDFNSSYDTKDDAVEAAKNLKEVDAECFHVVDTKTWTIVADYRLDQDYINWIKLQ